ncbi:winged helix DNA-binding protein [Bordetella sp. 15P40C-2]|uniref:winged helix DNA-binding protein n=1 Tax=Bordetella sp. 15P40C-2 TaxID=2572246 RepID=UPI00132400C1|nr:winged helix DNA-binding protein [Bordetella sp. 15P40C-2]MVW72604.1 winged helix DNA-binding protein [Bordetella sp. 15P40C-2]
MPPPLIASSAHLADGSAPDLSEVEFGLMIASHAFDRWIVRCMAAAGLPDLTPTDVMVFHHVYHRQRAKKLADICFTLNIEDTHIVNYALKKLDRMGMVRGERNGKEVFYSVTPEGAAIIKRYGEIREQCLTTGLTAPNGGELEFSRQLAHTLRALSGLYDQAARAATSL